MFDFWSFNEICKSFPTSLEESFCHLPVLLTRFYLFWGWSHPRVPNLWRDLTIKYLAQAIPCFTSIPQERWDQSYLFSNDKAIQRPSFMWGFHSQITSFKEALLPLNFTCCKAYDDCCVFGVGFRTVKNWNCSLCMYEAVVLISKTQGNCEIKWHNTDNIW